MEAFDLSCCEWRSRQFPLPLCSTHKKAGFLFQSPIPGSRNKLHPPLTLPVSLSPVVPMLPDPQSPDMLHRQSDFPHGYHSFQGDRRERAVLPVVCNTDGSPAPIHSFDIPRFHTSYGRGRTGFYNDTGLNPSFH